MYFSSPAYSEPPCCLLSVSNLHSEGRWSGGVLGNSCTHVPACSSSDRARKEGHMINCLPPGTSEHSHHDVGKNGNCSLSPSLHQFRTRVGRDMLSFFFCTPPPLLLIGQKGRHEETFVVIMTMITGEQLDPWRHLEIKFM